MKRLLFLLSFLGLGLLASAQTDTIHLTFKAKHFGFIVGGALTTQSLKDPDVQKVFNQVAEQLLIKDSIGRKWVRDTAQLITVTPKVGVVPKIFLAQGSMQERLATNYNHEMREMLLGVLMRRPDLLQAILALMEQNSRDTWQLVQYGFDYLITLKP
jgi:hypothetical protein